MGEANAKPTSFGGFGFFHVQAYPSRPEDWPQADPLVGEANAKPTSYGGFGFFHVQAYPSKPEDWQQADPLVGEANAKPTSYGGFGFFHVQAYPSKLGTPIHEKTPAPAGVLHCCRGRIRTSTEKLAATHRVSGSYPGR